MDVVDTHSEQNEDFPLDMYKACCKEWNAVPSSWYSTWSFPINMITFKKLLTITTKCNLQPKASNWQGNRGYPSGKY